MNLIGNTKVEKKTLGYYIENVSVDIKDTTAKKNINKFQNSNLSSETLKMVISKAILGYSTPEIINDESVIDWIKESTTKYNARNSRANIAYKLRKNIKEAEKGSPYLTDIIIKLQDLSETLNNTPTVVVMNNPKTYNNTKESRRLLQQSIQKLLVANKEFIPKESE